MRGVTILDTYPLNENELKLVLQYERLWQNGNVPPQWAFPIPPAIPAIGSKMTRHVLSFASSENIPHEYHEELSQEYRQKGFQHIVSRSRRIINRESINFPFPFRHISPFNNGNQFVLTWFVLSLLELELSNDIAEFSEQISTANPFKFTIRRSYKDNNVDPYQESHSDPSVPYLIEDLRIVNPEIIIIPKTRYQLIERRHSWRNLFEKADIHHSVTFGFIQQVVPQNINTRQRDPSQLDCSRIGTWIEHCRCCNTMRGHLAYLKEQWTLHKTSWVKTIQCT